MCSLFLVGNIYWEHRTQPCEGEGASGQIAGPHVHDDVVALDNLVGSVDWVKVQEQTPLVVLLALARPWLLGDLLQHLPQD